MIRFGIENAEQYAEENNLVKQHCIQCLCCLNELGVPDCENCGGSGVIVIDDYPDTFSFEIEYRTDLFKVLGLTPTKYGETWPHTICDNIINWTSSVEVCLEDAKRIFVPPSIFKFKNKLVGMCEEAKRREERIIWG